jgi:hypothetical protein
MRGNAYGSTLRLTLGCLLSDQLGIQLRRVGSGKRLTFTAAGEAVLSEWMDANAHVCWMACEEPWVVEQIIRSVNLPLNLRDNDQHPYCVTLRACRAGAKARARELPIFVC